MDTKELLQQAVDVSVAGDQQAAAALLKQLIQAKARAIVSEGLSLGADERVVTLEDYELPSGEIVNADLLISIINYTKPTTGNFSSRAMDPEEYSGTPEEIEWEIAGVTYVFDDGSTQELLHDEVRAFLLTTEETKFVERSLLDQIKNSHSL